VFVKDFDISLHQISESAQRLLDRAADQARRRGHTELWDAHLLLAFAQTERDLFEAALEDVGVDAARIIEQTETCLDAIPPGPERELHVPTETRLVCKLALRRANRVGRTTKQSACRLAISGTPRRIFTCGLTAGGSSLLPRVPRRSAALYRSAHSGVTHAT
jgi:ATP-dependent Clp protease ATP-binding subunit ClpA